VWIKNFLKIVIIIYKSDLLWITRVQKMFKIQSIFWIKILKFGFQNSNLEFQHQVLDQIFFFEVK
jgi:hypothetical protein